MESMNNTSDELFDVLKSCIDLPENVCELTLHLSNKAPALIDVTYYPIDKEGHILINKAKRKAIKRKEKFEIRRLKDGD